MQYVFTYGTLRPGQSNAGLIKGLHADTQAARLTGYTLWAWHGYGFPYAFAADGKEVLGDVYSFTSDRFGEALSRLDMLEGYRPEQPEASHYLRQRVQVQLVDASMLTVFVYIANPRTVIRRGLVPIGADWNARCQDRNDALRGA